MIATWYKETRELLDKKIGSNQQNRSLIDKLCVCVTSASADYCAAIMRLLYEGHEWPAKALMRCLGELDAKFTWCLDGCKDQDHSPETITKRIQSWEKTAYAEGIKLFDDFDSIVPAEDKEHHQTERNKLEELKKKLTVREMPNLKQVIEQLGNHYSQHVHAMFYCRFNSAVHLDPSVLVATYTNRGEGRDELMRHCLGYALSINGIIRSQYGYQKDFERIVTEYSEIMGKS